jgi:hypothetical protein
VTRGLLFFLLKKIQPGGSFMSIYRAKNQIMFPNKWALESFLLRLKRSSGWDYHASNDGEHIKVKPKGALDYILIALAKSGHAFQVDINAEKMGRGSDGAWTMIYEFARRYRS